MKGAKITNRRKFSVRKNKYFFILLFSYLIFFIMPSTILSVISFVQYSRTIVEQAADARLQALSQTAFYVDEFIYKIKEDACSLNTNAYVREYLDSHNPDILLTGHAFSQMLGFSVPKSYIKAIYLYKNDHPFILSTMGQKPLDDFSGRQVLRFLDSTPYRPFFIIPPDDMHNMPISFVLANSHNNETASSAVILDIDPNYLKKLIIGDINSLRGNLLILHSDDTPISYISSVVSEAGNKAYDSYKTQIEESGKNSGFFISDNGTFVSFFKSLRYGWTYIYDMPYPALRASIIPVKNATLLYYVLLVVLGTVLCYFTSRRLYNPITTLLDIIDNKNISNFPEKTASNELFYLKNVFLNLSEVNSKLESEYRENLPVLISKFVQDLLIGRIYDASVINDKIETYSLNFPMDTFCVIIVTLDDYIELSSSHSPKAIDILILSIVNIVSEIIKTEGGYGVSAIISPDRLASIINLDQPSKIMQISQKIRDMVNLCLKYSITIGIGRTVNSLTHISMSYNDAVMALNYKIYHGKNSIISIAEKNGQSGQNFIYPVEMEHQLMQQLHTGDMDKLTNTLDNLCAYAYTLNHNMVRQLFIQLLSTLIKNVYELGLDAGIFGITDGSIFSSFYMLDNIGDFKQWFLELCNKIREEITKKHNIKSSEYVVKALEYINANYHKNLSLDEVAGKVYLSSFYFSKIFKEHTGKSFTDYLIELRLRKAAELLSTTTKTVRTICELTGFNSQQYFALQFKKYFGLTPTRYRIEHSTNS